MTHLDRHHEYPLAQNHMDISLSSRGLVCSAVEAMVSRQGDCFLITETNNEWKCWFAWYPVTLLTMEIAWMRPVAYRRWTGWHHFSAKKRKWEYCNPAGAWSE